MEDVDVFLRCLALGGGASLTVDSALSMAYMAVSDGRCDKTDRTYNLGSRREVCLHRRRILP